MEEVGIVTKTEGMIAHVSVERKTACEHCTAGTCSLTSEGANIEAINNVHASVGQKVRVELQGYAYVSGSMFFYGIPAIALILGALFGMEVISGMFPGHDPEAITAVSAFACMGLSLVLVRLWSRKAERKKAYQPVVVEIIGTGLGNS